MSLVTKNCFIVFILLLVMRHGHQVICGSVLFVCVAKNVSFFPILLVPIEPGTVLIPSAYGITSLICILAAGFCIYAQKRLDLFLVADDFASGITVEKRSTTAPDFRVFLHL